MMREEKSFISSYTLKTVAIITMFIDHVTYAFSFLMTPGLYTIGRGIGRTAFPLFCFLLVEGVRHTKNRGRYFLSFLIFALLSEIPFDLLFSGSSSNPYHQNVFFTLSLGMAALLIIERVEQAGKNQTHGRLLLAAFFSLLQLLVAAGACSLAEFIRSDYGAMGVLLIFMIYYFEKFSGVLKPFFEGISELRLKNISACLAILLWFLLFDLRLGALNEGMGIGAVFLIVSYNGKRGTYGLPKYFFYLFYPLHILLLYFGRELYFR